VDSLTCLTPTWPIREADIREQTSDVRFIPAGSMGGRNTSIF